MSHREMEGAEDY